VHTGFVDRLLQNFPDPVAEKAAMDARQATGRMVTPAEVAVAVAYLASPLSGSTTGTALDVDGGSPTCGCARSDVSPVLGNGLSRPPPTSQRIG
jgi:NAD(P)-dependent dehydrogenase (short-subunit alcohol dehydrogenase family)